MQMTLTVPKFSSYSVVSEVIKPMLTLHRVFCFHGDLGAGKTTCIKQICSDLGVVTNMSSPSFSIVNEYETNSGEIIYHFDLFRIKSPLELMDIGWEEYLYSDNIALIEWPEMASAMIPEDAVHIYIEPNADESRSLTLKQTP
jgi:tRNA threonylcarbamoyladenosine biosynthesis protein TsaE